MWQEKLTRGLVVLLALWLMVTVAVAFLREAKAVRDSRKLLVDGDAQNAWQILGPFLEAHPKHHQALFLCGKATIRLDMRDDAKRCLDLVSELAPDLSGLLREDYRVIVREQLRTPRCEASSFENAIAWTDDLGQEYEKALRESLGSFVEACLKTSGSPVPHRMAEFFAAKGQAMELVDQGYGPALRRALARKRYGDAETLAGEAVSLIPDSAPTIKAILSEERAKVRATMTILRGLRDELQADSRYHTGYYACYAADMPAVVKAARDGWGNALAYTPGRHYLNYETQQPCYQEFALISYGSDGVATEDGEGTPAAELSCRPTGYWGGEDCTFPEGFWQRE